jgi:hypothetical protein
MLLQGRFNVVEVEDGDERVTQNSQRSAARQTPISHSASSVSSPNTTPYSTVTRKKFPCSK